MNAVGSRLGSRAAPSLRLPSLALACLVLTSLPVPAATSATVDPRVLDAVRSGPADVLVVLRGPAAARSLQATDGASDPAADRATRGRSVVQRLRDDAAISQASLRALLRSRNATHRAFWIVDAIRVRADAALVAELAARSDVDRIVADPPRPALPDEPVDNEMWTEPAALTAGIEWNVAKVEAPALWAQGIDGHGVVVASADTGVDWDHVALRSHYRGWNGVTASHDHHWHDAVDWVLEDDCGAPPLATPCDPNSHGTHTVGTMVGDDGLGNQIGVAPGARWMGCRNMDGLGNGTLGSYLDCFEFFLAPTNLAGGDPRPELAPDVINNSWTCVAPEGCADPEILREAVQAARAAGILVVAAAGNSGPSCSSIATPPAIYAAAFTVGATNSLDQLASFSSRGPVTVGSGGPKPDLVAPGVSIRSALPGNSYGSKQGTSMAAPHAAGVAALLIDATSCLRRQPQALASRLIEGVTALAISDTCSAPGSGLPSALTGWGRLRAWLPPATCPLLVEGFDRSGFGGFEAGP